MSDEQYLDRKARAIRDGIRGRMKATTGLDVVPQAPKLVTGKAYITEQQMTVVDIDSMRLQLNMEYKSVGASYAEAHANAERLIAAVRGWVAENNVMLGVLGKPVLNNFNDDDDHAGNNTSTVDIQLSYLRGE